MFTYAVQKTRWGSLVVLSQGEELGPRELTGSLDVLQLSASQTFWFRVGVFVIHCILKVFEKLLKINCQNSEMIKRQTQNRKGHFFFFYYLLFHRHKLTG